MAKLLPLPAQNVAFVNKEDGTPTTVFYTWLQSLMNCLGQWFPLSGVTISPDSGSITSYTASCRFLQLGKIVLVWLEIDITNAGTGSSTLNVVFPSALPQPLQAQVPLVGYEASGDEAIFGELLNDRSMRIRFFDNSSVVITGAVLILSGTYEAA